MEADRFFRLRSPVSPGIFIQEDILDEFGLTQEGLAKRLGVSRRAVNELVNGKRAISPEMALRLGVLTGTTPEFWLSLQAAVDLSKALEIVGENILQITPLSTEGKSAEENGEL